MKLAAVFGSVGPSSPKEYVERMCQAQVVQDWHSVDVFDVPGGAIGVIYTSERYGTIPMLVKGQNGNVLAVSGVPTKSGQLRAFLQQVVEMDTAQAFQALTEMDGAYAAVFWQEKEKKALMVPDFMGFQPVYVHRAQQGIAFASEIKAFSIGRVVPVQPDPAGWGAFVTFGHIVGEQTQLAGVSRIRGERMCYDPESNDLVKEPYWTWPERSRQTQFEEISTEFILDCFHREVDAYREYGVQDNTLLMSSGFDSRFILCLLKENEIPIKTLSVVHKNHFGGAEGKLGYRMARHLGVEQARLVDALSGHEGEIAKDHYLVMNDVATPGRGLFISNVSAQVERLSGGVWEGFAPGYTLTQLTDQNMDTYLTKKNLAEDSGRWQPAAAVFSREFLHAMQEGLMENIRREREMYGEDDYGVMRFIFKNRALNRTVTNPLKVYANTALPFTPGMSARFWDYIASIPPLTIEDSERKLFRKIYCNDFKKACEIPFCSEKGLFTGDGRFSAEITWKNFLYSLHYYYERRRKIPIVGCLFAKAPLETNSYIDDFLKQHNMDLKESVHPGCDYINSAFSWQETEGANGSFQRNKEKTLLYYFLCWVDVMEGKLTVH